MRPAAVRPVIFNSSLFVAFFVAVFIAYFHVASGRGQKLSVLLAANLIFFASWNLAFVPLLLATGLADFYLARAMAAPGAGRGLRTVLVSASVVMNVGVMVVFKYLDFLLKVGAFALRFGGRDVQAPSFGWLAPVGLSFYAFQGMSYTIDVYRGVFAPKCSRLEFLASFTFFPHLLSGPIVRSSFLIPQFSELKPPDRAALERGLALIMVGLTKKALADLVSPVVDLLFARSHPAGAVASWTGALGFSAQMYGDFSGYIDMATGLALLLGFELPPNFNLPYLATSPADFWRRWNISLSTWFRDYLYYPLALGGLRDWPYLNVFLVMLAAGLWHGAGAKFAAFGAYHGLLLAGLYWCSSNHVDLIKNRIVKTAVTFYLTVIGQVVFRAESWAGFVAVIRGLHFLGGAQAASGRELALLLIVIGALLAGHVLDYVFLIKRCLSERPLFLRLAATAACVFAFMVRTIPTFIYLKF